MRIGDYFSGNMALSPGNSNVPRGHALYVLLIGVRARSVLLDFNPLRSNSQNCR